MSARDFDRQPSPLNVNINNSKPVPIPHRPYIRFARAAASPAGSQPEPWDVAALCSAYGWPKALSGGGVIAIVELAGGWLSADLKLFCDNNGIPVPLMTDVSVDGTRASPGTDPDADGEVALDIQVSAAAYSLATGAPATIRVQ